MAVEFANYSEQHYTYAIIVAFYCGYKTIPTKEQCKRFLDRWYETNSEYPDTNLDIFVKYLNPPHDDLDPKNPIDHWKGILNESRMYHRDTTNPSLDFSKPWSYSVYIIKKLNLI
jgi:hypothetical protein